MTRTFLPHVITDDSALGGKVIERSVRCMEDDNAYFSRTSTVAGDRRTFTLSGWFKFYQGEGNQDFIFMCGDSPDNQLQLSREGNEKINFEPKTGGSTDARFYTKNLFRDDDAWYHLVLKIDTTQSTASDRMALYINGTQAEYDTDIVATTYPSQNLEFNWGANSERYDMMRRTISGYETNSDGAIADVHYVSGYAYDPTAFGYFDDQTGIWRPKKYTGSYGSAGWHLEFKDNSATTATTLGKDTSGNGNNWTPTNISTHDVLPDTPTNVFAVWNSVDGEGKDNESSFSEGNLKVQIAYQGNDEETGATLSFSSGKWYWEEYMQASTADASMVGVGVKSIEGIYANGGNHWRVRGGGGESDNNGSQTNVSGFSWTTGDIIGIAVDMDNGNWTASKNGSWIGANIHTNLSGTVVPTMHNSNGSERHTFIANFGQDSSFAGTKTAQGNKDSFGIGDFYYAVPSGYRALCSKNLFSTATSIVRPQKHFDILTYTGDQTDGTRSITGLEFTPDFVWLKCRSSATSHNIYDSVRGFGANKEICSDKTQAEGGEAGSQYGYVNQNSRGFDLVAGSDSTLGSRVYNININSATYVAWCWKAGGAAVSNSDGSITSSVSANQEAGFSIGTFTGTGSNGSIGHGLGKVPAMIIAKSRTHTDNWFIYHKFLGANAYIMLNNTNAADTNNSTVWQNVAPTSSVFYSSTGGYNDSGESIVFYCWAEIPGYSKFGTYKADGRTDGPYIHTGFRPAFIWLLKTSGENGVIFDVKRDPLNYLGLNGRLYASVSNAQGSGGTVDGDIHAHGFKLRNTTGEISTGSEQYIFMAFADQPSGLPYDTLSNIYP